MKITLRKEAIEELKGVLSDKNYERLERDLRYYSSKDLVIDLKLLDMNEIKAFADYLKSKKARIGYLKVLNYLEVIESPNDTKMLDLETFADVFKNYVRDLERKWIFLNEKGDLLPYYISEIVFVPSSGRGENYSEAYVRAKLLANTINGCSSKNITFDLAEIKGKTLKEIINRENMIIENPEIIKDFLEMEERYLAEKHNFNKQYITKGPFVVKGWYRSEIKESAGICKVINDEEINESKITLRVATSYWSKDKEDEVQTIPCHPYLYLYSLSTYENIYVHISNLTDYIYDDSVRDKLILPQTHKDLLDILTNDLSILSGDIISGKSTGTTILCKGEPGTGKTLTAEAYSEITHRPLYKVNSGQLGTSASDVEKNLETILKRAERWNAVLLLDEADTYIRKRANEIDQNAIVAAFLRTLEYFHGLLFMTTNRINDVDDAIESRCIAQILYEIPTKNNAARIWRVLANEFDIKIEDSLIEELTEKFPTMSGRDIKELLRLTARFCNAKDLELSIDSFVSCAQFRGIKIKE